MTRKIPKQGQRAIRVNTSVPALVFAEPEVGGYSAEVPALPGCYAQGETLREIKTNLREAIEGWLAAAHDEGVRSVSGRRASA